MITEFKIYESKIKWKVGDYVIANSKYASPKTQDFFKNNIGQLSNVGSMCKVEYDYNIIPDDVFLDDNSYWFQIDEILQHFKTKDDAELYMATNKYNL